MQVAYMTRKVFADDSEEIRIKINKLITENTVKAAKKTKFINKIRREYKNKKVEEEIFALNLFDPQYQRKRRLLNSELHISNVQNMCRSASRSRQSLYDICKCNEFDFFVTLTFDAEKVDRFDDKKTKRKYTQWVNYVKKQFPDMFFVTVPEYHKRGALHFHMLVGGVTMEELKCVPALTKRGKLKYKHGKQIFNITAWRWGFSTLSKVENSEASKHYICKYITKQHYDDRFFNKRRYYVSQNIKRPFIEKWHVSPERCLDGIDDNVHLVAFLDPQKQFAVLETDGNGIVNMTMNAPKVKEDLKRLRTRAGGGGLSARRAGAGVRYSTFRTLDRNSENSYSDICALQERLRLNEITDEEYLQEIGLID